METLEKDKIEQVQKKDKDKDIVEKKQGKYTPRTYKSREDIPKDYLENLKEMLNVKEDPLGEHEAKLREMGLLKDRYDYDSLYSDVEDPGTVDYVETMADIINDSNDTDSKSNESTCSVCELKELNKQRRLETIKNTILKKVGFTSNNLPNMTGKTIPKIPSIQHLLDYHEMQSDAPYDDYYPEDDTYGQVKRAYKIAQTRK